MSTAINDLESQYRRYAEAFGAAIVRGDAEAANRNFDKLIPIGRKLRAYGERGEAALRRLMKDRSDAVATWAATDSLSFAEAQGLEVLDAIAKGHGPVAFEARMTAKQWRAGELKSRWQSSAGRGK